MLAFELLNEVTEREYGPVWNRIAAACVRRIRAYAPETKILIGGYWHNSAAAVKDLPEPFDENIVYNFHCYEPLIFTHQGAYWMPPMETSFRIPVTATYGEMAEAGRRYLNGSQAGLEALPADGHLDSAYFEAFLAEAVRTAESRNVPLYCGEYGVIDKASPEDALRWYSMIHAAFEKYGIGRAAWSYRQMDFPHGRRAARPAPVSVRRVFGLTDQSGWPRSIRNENKRGVYPLVCLCFVETRRQPSRFCSSSATACTFRPMTTWMLVGPGFTTPLAPAPLMRASSRRL